MWAPRKLLVRTKMPVRLIESIKTMGNRFSEHISRLFRMMSVPDLKVRFKFIGMSWNLNSNLIMHVHEHRLENVSNLLRTREW